MKRFFSGLLVCVFLLGLLPTAALAVEGVPYLDRHWDESTKQVITENKTVSNSMAVTADDTAWGTEGVTTWYVVSSGVTISSRITITGDVHLILADGYQLTASAGINVSGSLTIYGQIGGTGALTANGGVNGEAGIAGGTITINGGVVNAEGNGERGPGISSESTITINGGGVKAEGHNTGAGISVGPNGTVIINGGDVEARGGGYGAAGIGGDRENSGGTILINDGIVMALSAYGGAGIGGGWSGVGGTITISGGTVTATGGSYGAGIGGSCGGAGGTITISGGTVTATGGDNYGAGIGGSYGGAGGTITISGGTVTARGSSGVGIGGSSGGDSGTITISGGTVTASGREGIGSRGGNFSTGIGGSAFIVVSSISAETNQNSWSGVIFQGNSGQVYGNQTIQSNVEIPNGKTLTIPEGSTLTVAGTITNNGTLTINGTIIFEDSGSISTITGSGTTQEVPTEITAMEQSADSITLSAAGTRPAALLQYSKDNSTWQSSPTFTGLGAGTSYTFYARYAKCYTSNTLYAASAPISQTFNTAYATPGANEGYSINCIQETITVNDGYEVNTSQDFSGTAITSGQSLTDHIGGTLYTRKAVNGNIPASTGAQIAIPARPAAPTGLQGIAVSIAGKQDGQITGVSADMEYKLSTADSWTVCTGTEITGLAAGVYQVRMKATSDTFASEAAPVTVPSGQVRTYTLTVNGGTGGGSYRLGDTVTITATVPSGQRFTGWTVNAGGVTLANASSATTTFTMPAQAVTITANFQSNSGDGSSGGGGGDSYTPPTYKPDVSKPSGGGGAAPTVSPSNPKQGDTVTVTPKPDDGYEVDKITVTDKGGNNVPVTKKPNGTYTFTQPGGRVTIEIEYAPVPLTDLPWNNPFTDVAEGDWYYEAVRFVQERGLMNGYSDGRFGPNDTLSRAQLAQILFNKEGRPVVVGGDFNDVDSGAWYADAVTWAAANGIVGGYGDGRFGPNDPITREQLAVMLWRYSGSPAATDKERHFNDVDEISPFALEALRWVVENGVLNGYGDGRLGPREQATRAQVAQMLKNFIENQEENT